MANSNESLVALTVSTLMLALGGKHYLQGPRNDFILGGAHCFSTFENATFLE